MAIGSITSVRWKKSKLRSFSASVIKAVVSAAYEISHHQADGDSLFEIRQVIAGLREYQSDEDSDGDSSDDERVVMAPRCRKHPEGGPLVGVCPFCLRACLSKLAEAQAQGADPCSGDSSSEASSPAASGRSMSIESKGQGADNRGEQGILSAVKVIPSSSKPLKASAPLAALKEDIPRYAAASRKASQTQGSDPRKLEARKSSGSEGRVGSGGASHIVTDVGASEKSTSKADGGRRISTAQVVHQYCARSDLKSSGTGHFAKSRNGKANSTGISGSEGSADRGSEEIRAARLSHSERNPSLLSIMLRDRWKGGKDPSTDDKAGPRDQHTGEGKGGDTTAPVSQRSSGNVSWVARIRSRRPADAQSVAKKLAVSALVHPDGVAV